MAHVLKAKEQQAIPQQLNKERVTGTTYDLFFYARAAIESGYPRRHTSYPRRTWIGKYENNFKCEIQTSLSLSLSL
jgi:hypothetical protein